MGIDKLRIDRVGSWPNGNWRSGNWQSGNWQSGKIPHIPWLPCYNSYLTGYKAHGAGRPAQPSNLKSKQHKIFMVKEKWRVHFWVPAFEWTVCLSADAVTTDTPTTITPTTDLPTTTVRTWATGSFAQAKAGTRKRTCYFSFTMKCLRCYAFQVARLGWPAGAMHLVCIRTIR